MALAFVWYEHDFKLQSHRAKVKFKAKSLQKDGNVFSNRRSIIYRKSVTPQSGFPQTHKIGNIGIIANFVFPYLHFPSLFAPYDISIYDIRYQWIWVD